MTVKIEIGKYYRTRSGLKVGPISRYNALEHPYIWRPAGWLWTENGERYAGQEEHDIIAEWADDQPLAGPVVIETITRKRIVPGVYGDVVVLNDGPRSVSMMPCNTVEGLTAAITTLTAIRDAMQEAQP